MSEVVSLPLEKYGALELSRQFEACSAERAW